MELLKSLCEVFAPSGNEVQMKNFVLDYVEKHKENWKTTPKIIAGDDFQDCIILVFGNTVKKELKLKRIELS